jgi:hypothetical protein
MHDMQVLLIGEIQRQSNFALISFEEIRKSFENNGPWDNSKSDHLWCSVQSFLVAVANISKILWPSSPCGSELPSKIKLQREQIRNLLSLNTSSPLRIRKFRNYFEHYDFELEKWFKKLKDRMIVDSNIIDFDPSGLPSNRAFFIRNFNPRVFKIYFKNEEYDMVLTVNAVNNLLKKIQQLN